MGIDMNIDSENALVYRDFREETDKIQAMPV